MRHGLWVGGLLLLCSTLALAGPPPGVHPLVVASYGKAPCANLLGGTVNGTWVDARDLWKRVTGGEQYQLYSPYQRLGTTIGKPAVSTPGDPSTEAPAVALAVSKAIRESKEAIIGICGTWNALPRVPTPQRPDQPVYQHLVRSLLDQHRMQTARVHITRVWRIDLEGDGTDEVLIEASAPHLTYEKNAKNYSLVLLRKIVHGRVTTLPLDAYYGSEGDLATRTELKAVLDVNGDGFLEIITAWSWYDGHGYTVTTIVKGKGTDVLNSGYGR